MRILLIGMGYGNTPIEIEQTSKNINILVQKVGKGLQQLGNDVDYLALPAGEVSKWHYLRAGFKFFMLSITGKLKKYDIIHAHYGFVGVIARCQWMKPVVVTFMGSDVYIPWQGRLGRFLSRFIQGNIVQQNEMIKILGLSSDKTSIIPYGVDTDIFYPMDKAQARQELNLPLNKKLICFPYDPSREVKRFDVIENAIKLLSDIEIVSVYGKSAETVALNMNACDVMVMTSNHEGSPTAIREALACNLPIVSVDVGDVKDRINGLSNCYICERNPESVAEKLTIVFKSNEQLTNGFDSIYEVSIKVTSEKTVALYNQILKK